MSINEGSVEVDGEGFDSEGEESSVEGQETTEGSGEDQNQNDSTDETTTSTQDTTTDGDQTNKDQETAGKTDKGTKLAEDPIQQANQLRANAEARAKEYEQFLSDPRQVEAYLNELKKEAGENTDQQEDEGEMLTADKIETVEDLQKFAKQLESKFEKRLKEADAKEQQKSEIEKINAVGEKIVNQISEVRTKYPALREKNADGSANPDFDPELERELGELFEELDFDPKKGVYKGGVDFAKLTDRFMKGRQSGEKAGSKNAQTIVKDRRQGRSVSGSQGSSGTDESAMTPSQKIASRMQKVRGTR